MIVAPFPVIATPFLVAFFMSFLTAPLLRSLAVKFDIVDHPAVRKIQTEPVPLSGGTAVYLGIVCGGFPFFIADKDFLSILVGLSLIFAISLIDDARELSANIRLIVQITAATLLISSGLKVTFLPNNPLGHLGDIIITYIWILGITNAFNYLDGLDGLCSGLGVISSFFLFMVLGTTGQHNLVFLPLVLMGACLGFMPFNFSRKMKMFLGDSGSTLIGFLLAAISLIGDYAGENLIKLIVPILIFGVPIFDMTFTTVMRIAEKKVHNVLEWFEYAGRDHFHHHLIDLGLRPGGAVLFIYAVSFSMGLSALLIAKETHLFRGILMIVSSFIMFYLIGVLMVLGRRLHKKNEVRERMGI